MTEGTEVLPSRAHGFGLGHVAEKPLPRAGQSSDGGDQQAGV